MILKNTISSFFLGVSILISNVLHAEEKMLATVTNDSNKTSYKLIVDSKTGHDITNFYKDVYEDGIKTHREALDVEVLHGDGMVLEKRKNHIVIKLKSDNFDSNQGGLVVVDTLYNGVSGERKEYEVEIAQDKNGWSLFKNGKMIKQIQIETNRVIVIGEVGIKNLVMK